MQNGLRVKVYFNLTRKCLSVVALEGVSKGRVVAYTDEVQLTNVSFVVREGGRQRVLATKQKNVHAFVVGRLAEQVKVEGERVTYNPYKYSTFVKADGEQPIHRADAAQVKGRLVLV